MSMNWDAISTIAEIIGAFGVIASLTYLAIQIRQSTKVARADMTKDLYLASRTAIMDIAVNEELTKIWADIREMESTDAARRWAFFQSFFRLYELQYKFAQLDLLDEDIADSYKLVIRMFAGMKKFPAYWSQSRGTFSTPFASYVDQQIEIVNEQSQDRNTSS